MIMQKILLLTLTAFFIATAPLSQVIAATYYVVRHADKQDGDNPMLTAKGVKRAAHIAKMLKDEPIITVYSTETNRTIMTATPTAADKGVAVELFSTDDLEGFATHLKSKDGTMLIVAHSSSTPDLASLLSGVKIPKLDETDFEQLFKVTITDGVASLKKMTTTFE